MSLIYQLQLWVSFFLQASIKYWIILELKEIYIILGMLIFNHMDRFTKVKCKLCSSLRVCKLNFSLEPTVL